MDPFWASMPWEMVTHLGDTAVLLPLTIAMVASASMTDEALRTKYVWVIPLVWAFGLVTVTKMLYLTLGLGGSIDFTGLSGHAALSASLFPVFAFRLTRALQSQARWLAVAAAVVVASIVAVSRLMLCVHSNIEVASGVLVGAGAAVSSITILSTRPPDRVSGMRPLIGCAVFLLGFTVLFRAVPQDLMAEFARKVSGRPAHLRSDLHPDLRSNESRR